MKEKRFPGGVWPVMLTPFTEENQVDYPALKELVEWYIENGVDGLFAVCQSSEMFKLTLEERVGIAAKVKEFAAGRVPVIASGHISDSLEEQIHELKLIAETGVDAVIMITNRMAAEDESDMRNHGVKNLIFSSSATVYGDPAFVPITEECPKGEVTNPYGRTKSMLEQVLTDLHTADPEWNILLLRYFNPIGAHESGLIGEDPKGIPNNLVPYIAQVAVGKLKCLGVFGDDYNTPDGTGVRDYIHVVDLAKGHVKALKKLAPGSGVNIYNLGTGKGYSVLDVLHAFEKACGKTLPYEIKPRRAGDIATCYCDASKAERELGWKAEFGIDRMCVDSWRWQSNNPNGYAG